MSDRLDVLPLHRRMVCDDRTAARMATAAALVQLRRPSTWCWAALPVVVTAAPLLVAGRWQATTVTAAAVLAVGLVVLALALRRRALALTRRTCPPGAELALELTADELGLTTAIGHHELPWGQLRDARLVAGHLVLPLREVAVSLLVPRTLLTNDEIGLVQALVSRPSSPPSHGPSASAGTGSSPTDERAVVLTPEMARRLQREATRYVLRGRMPVTLAMIGAGVVVAARGAGLPWAAALALGTGGGALLLGWLVARLRRSLARTSTPGQAVVVGSDGEQLHVSSETGRGDLRFSVFRSWHLQRGVLLLESRSGGLSALPVEALSPETLQRVQAAVPARRRPPAADQPRRTA